jgi:hypothetical protein
MGGEERQHEVPVESCLPSELEGGMESVSTLAASRLEEGAGSRRRGDASQARWWPEVPPFFRALGQGTRGPPLPPHPMAYGSGRRMEGAAVALFPAGGSESVLGEYGEKHGVGWRGFGIGGTSRCVSSLPISRRWCTGPGR